MAGAGFVSNFALWNESGYFDKAAATKPLLHLWSLGIEEQFYLLWPPLLCWAWKRKADVLGIAVAIVSISFAINVMLVSLWQASDTYFLPLTRFWELLLGSALAYTCLFQKHRFDSACDRIVRSLPGLRTFTKENIQAWAGLLLILIAISSFNERILFPGWWALLPTLGTALLISAGAEAWINRNLLSRRPLVFVGLISYPLYLWHWPLLSYAHIVQPGPLPITTIAPAVTAAFVLSWLTFRFVEKPMRAMPNPWALAWAFGLFATGCLGFAAFGRQIQARSHFYGLEKIIAAQTGKWDFPEKSLRPLHTSLGYHFEGGNAAPRVLFVGDSHVQQYYPRIDRLLQEHPDTAKGVAFVSQLMCPPITYVEGLMRSGCKGLIENAFAVADDLNVDTVVIAAAWYRYQAFDLNNPNQFQNLAAVIRRFNAGGRRVYIVLSIPRGDVFEPSRLVQRSFGVPGFSVIQQIPRSEVDAGVKALAAKLTDVARSNGAIAIDPVNQICPLGDCPTLSDYGLPKYCDDSHLRSDYVRNHITFLDDIVLTPDGDTVFRASR